MKWCALGLSAALLIGCASDRSIVGPGARPLGTLIPAGPVRLRCAQPTGALYKAFVVVDGVLHLPGDSSWAPIEPSEVAAIEVLRGETAAARYGPVASTAGVLVITTKRARGAGIRPAPDVALKLSGDGY